MFYVPKDTRTNIFGVHRVSIFFALFVMDERTRLNFGVVKFPCFATSLVTPLDRESK